MGNYFFNTQIDKCFRKRTVLLKKTYDMTKVWGHSKRASRHLGMKGGEVNKKCDATHSKKRDFASDVLFE